MHDVIRRPQELSRSDLRLLKELCELNFSMARYGRVPSHLKRRARHLLARMRRRGLHCLEHAVRLPHHMPYYVWPRLFFESFSRLANNP